MSPTLETPNFLCVVVERGPASLQESQKCAKLVQFSSALSIPFFKLQSGALRFDCLHSYKAIAFAEHKGESASCGHYVAYTESNGRWICHDDGKNAAIAESISFDTAPVFILYEKSA